MKKPIKTLLILLTIASIAFAVWHFLALPETDDARLTLYGNIDIRQVELTFHDPEHIAEMYVKEGDHVSKGQLLAIQDLERFQYAVESSEARVEAQRQIVMKLVTGSRPEDIRKARADVKSAEALVVFTSKELKRLQTLVKRKLTSKESVDRTQSEYITAKEKSHALKQQLELAVSAPARKTLPKRKRS